MTTSRIAFVFAILFLAISLPAQVSQGDSLALVAFYNAFDGPNWDDSEGWLTDPVGSWKGITIEDGRVTRISLAGNNLTGSLPDEMGNLAALWYVYLNQNNISGSIPASLADLPNLRYLSLQTNELSGSIPEFLAEIDSLRELDLYGNEFTGALPDLSDLKAMEDLLFGRNDLDPADFPDWILELPNLTYINFTSMGLMGELPEGFFDLMPNMREFVVCGNDLEGDIAALFGDSTHLDRFEICDNNFHGNIPDRVINPEISRWAAQNNQLTGIPDFSAVQDTKAWFWLHGNKMGFEQLVKALDVETVNNDSRRSYGPQKPLLQADTILLEEEGTVTMQAGSEHDLDQYQWYHDGEPIDGATDRSLTIDNFEASDAGVYTCIISHPEFEFTLERSPVTLKQDGVSATSDVLGTGLRVYPNPTHGVLHISVPVETIEVYDLFGRTVLSGYDQSLDVSSLVAGTYVLIARTRAVTYRSKFVKL